MRMRIYVRMHAYAYIRTYACVWRAAGIRAYIAAYMAYIAAYAAYIYMRMRIYVRVLYRVCVLRTDRVL